MTKTAYEKAIATRKKRLRDKKRVAKKRSENARRAALIRWGKWDHRKNKPKAIVQKKTVKKTPPKKKSPTPPKKKKSPLQKKTPPKKRRKTRAELERELEIEKKRVRNEKRKARNAEKKRKQAEEKARLLLEGIRDIGLGPEILGEKSRFIQLSHLPEKLQDETDERYAERIVRQMVKEDIYTIEEAYKTLADEFEMSTKAVWSLWMSPKPIPSVA